MSDGGVIHNVPVLSPGGDRLGTAVVAKGHIEIVFDHMNLAGYIFEPLLYNWADGIIINPHLLPGAQKE